jgi:hypothetical protein
MQKVLVINGVFGSSTYLRVLLLLFSLMGFLDLAADVLQSMISASMKYGLLRRPLSPQCSTSFSIIHYAGDTLILMQADV